jgi:hypothetical protein
MMDKCLDFCDYFLESYSCSPSFFFQDMDQRYGDYGDEQGMVEKVVAVHGI